MCVMPFHYLYNPFGYIPRNASPNALIRAADFHSGLIDAIIKSVLFRIFVRRLG